MSEKEQALKAAYNAYIDALVDYMEEIKPACKQPSDNTAVKYLLDQPQILNPVFPWALAASKVFAFDTAALQAKKVL